MALVNWPCLLPSYLNVKLITVQGKHYQTLCFITSLRAQGYIIPKHLSATGRRGQEVIVTVKSDGTSEVPGSNPGQTTCNSPVTEIYIPGCTCRLQWATIRWGKHVHAGCMSLNMKFSPCFWTCCQYGTQSKSLCSVLHTPNLIPYLNPNLNRIHLWSMIQVISNVY